MNIRYKNTVIYHFQTLGTRLETRTYFFVVGAKLQDGVIVFGSCVQNRLISDIFDEIWVTLINRILYQRHINIEIFIHLSNFETLKSTYMKFKSLLIVLFFTLNICIAQNMNQGGAIPAEYYSVLPYDEVSDLMFISAEINDKTYRFLFDTGAPNIISKALQSELNFKVESKMRITDASGKKDSMLLVTVDRIKLGDTEFANIPTLVTDNILLECFNIDGFIGSNMLRNSIVRISSIDKTITITNLKEKLNLNKEYSSKLYLNQQSSPYFTAYLKNKKSKKEKILFDSGAQQFLSLPQKVFDKYEKDGIYKIKDYGTGSSKIGIHGREQGKSQTLFDCQNLVINGAILENVPATTNQSDHSRIGAPLVKYGIVTLDYLNKKIYFEAFKQNINLEEKYFPFDLSFDQKLIIGVVWGKELEGIISPGDQVISIDGKSYENMTFCEYVITITDFPYKSQEEVTLTLKNSEGTVKEYTLKKK